MRVKTRRIFLGAAASLVLLAAAGWAVPLEGPWVDFTVSKFLTRQTGLPIHCEKTRVYQWSRVSFLAVIDRKDLKPSEIFRAMHVLFSSPVTGGFEGAFSVDRPRVGFSGNHSRGLVRILRCESGDLSVRGGLVLKDDQPVKAHLYFSLAPSRLKKLPPLIRSRLGQAGGGWAAMHVVFYRDQLTLSGRHGPLFQAKWQGHLG